MSGQIYQRKVGILTFTYGDNYGQRLQNLAVQEVINSYGYKAYTIPQIIPKYYHPKNKVRHAYFKEFDDQFINYYDMPIGKNKVPEGMDSFSYFVAGSDQIWSPYSPDVNSSFFLTFTTKDKRIAFSPSMAAAKIPIRKKLLYRWYLKGFNKLSVREEKSASLIQKLTSKPVSTLIDPTLMFASGFWMQYVKKPGYKIPQRYLLYYGLGNSNEIENIIEIAKRENCEIIFLKDGSDEFNVGPSEFLYLIQNATYVATDSYHGTIFSIIFKKPFMYLEREQNGLDMSSRFDTLFSKLSIDNGKIKSIGSSNIDFDMIYDKINKEREIVDDYLSNYFIK